MNIYNTIIDIFTLIKIKKITKRNKIVLLTNDKLKQKFHFDKATINTSLKRLKDNGFINDTYEEGKIGTHALQITDKGLAHLKAIIPIIIIEIIIFIAGMVVECLTDIIESIFGLL